MFFSFRLLTAGCITLQFQPIQCSTGAQESSDSVVVRIFLPHMIRQERSLFVFYGSVLGIHQKVEAELQKVGRQKEANGAYRIGYGTYDHDKDGIVSYLLFRYLSDERL